MPNFLIEASLTFISQVQLLSLTPLPLENICPMFTLAPLILLRP